LKITSLFADKIIILDQCSHDRSKEICLSYEKVDYNYYDSESFDAKKRRSFLYNRARELYIGEKIIFSLDCDEILAANAMQTNGWQTMLSAEAGSVLFFEKPDLIKGFSKCIRYPSNFWPLGLRRTMVQNINLKKSIAKKHLNLEVQLIYL
jgi:hypothetical protein